MTRRKKQRQRVTPPKLHREIELVSVTEVTPDNIEEIIDRFFTGPGIYGEFVFEEDDE